MVQLPLLTKDLPLTRLSNSVLVGTMKFTLDQFNAFFTAQNPAPSRLAQQLTSFSGAYNSLNAAYALTRESLITQDISALDSEGDQLFIGIKETVEGACRMTAVAARKEAGDRLNLFIKKYKIDTKENFISEWSKMQQLCEEANASASLTADLATLGLTDVMARLTEVADLLRQKLTERSAELPSQQAMKQAREAIYPEYRTLIDLLNAFALTNDNTSAYATLIRTLNDNIDYVRIHAMTGGSSSGGSNSGGGGSDDNGGGGDNPDTPDNPDNPDPVNPDPVNPDPVNPDPVNPDPSPEDDH